MPKPGGALIPGDEKLFPESEAGKMDPSVRVTRRRWLSRRLPLFRWGYNFLESAGGCGRGQEMTLAFSQGSLKRCSFKAGCKS